MVICIMSFGSKQYHASYQTLIETFQNFIMQKRTCRVNMLGNFFEILIDSCVKFHCFGPCFEQRFQFSILQESGKLPNLKERLYRSRTDSDKTCELSLRKRPNISPITAA